MSGRVTLLLGGARSGKSKRALDLAQTPPLTFLATAEAFDDEMRARIDAHKEERRNLGWALIEDPLDLAAALQNHTEGCLVIDCLTLWLNNLIFYERNVETEVSRLTEHLPAGGDVILVSNEVGLAIAPENALARRFRDLQGQLNQQVARVADRVELLVAGLPVVVKDGT